MRYVVKKVLQYWKAPDTFVDSIDDAFIFRSYGMASFYAERYDAIAVPVQIIEVIPDDEAIAITEV